MKTLPLVVLPLLLSAGLSSAATVAAVGTPARTNASPAITLPTGAGTDWGLWASSTNPTLGTASITSNIGTQTFEVTTVGGSNTPTTRGSSQAADTRFNFSNGDTVTDPTTNFQVGGVFNTGGIGANINAGVALTLTSIASPVRINLYTYIFEGTSVMNVYLDGSGTAAYTVTQADTINGKAGYLYAFDYTPDSAASTIRFEYIKTTSDDSNSNVGFAGISITPVPEPSSLALFGAAALTGLLRRRRA